MGYVHDTGNEGVQALALDDLRLAWDVNVPGLGKRNRLVVLDIPQELPPDDVLIRQSCFSRVADAETGAYTALNKIVEEAGFSAAA